MDPRDPTSQSERLTVAFAHVMSAPRRSRASRVSPTSRRPTSPIVASVRLGRLVPPRAPIRARARSGRRRSCCARTTRRWTSTPFAASRSPTPVTSRQPVRHRRRHQQVERAARRAPRAAASSLLSLGGDHTSRCRCCARRTTPRPDRPSALRRPPRHLGHLLRGRVHPRHALPPRLRGGSARPGAIRRTSASAARSTGRRISSDDAALGFQIVPTDDVIGRRRRGHRADPRPPSAICRSTSRIDIDVLDPAHAPGTGTPEAGGLTTRELLLILRGMAGLPLVGADIVEVAPAYDHAEITGSPRRISPTSCSRCSPWLRKADFSPARPIPAQPGPHAP